jgi:orotidine-5'-phosphate decarboxylase
MRDDRLEGGVVNASRSVASPAGSLEAATVAGWETLIDAAVAAAQADLLTATRR